MGEQEPPKEGGPSASAAAPRARSAGAATDATATASGAGATGGLAAGTDGARTGGEESAAAAAGGGAGRGRGAAGGAAARPSRATGRRRRGPRRGPLGRRRRALRRRRRPGQLRRRRLRRPAAAEEAAAVQRRPPRLHERQVPPATPSTRRHRLTAHRRLLARGHRPVVRISDRRRQRRARTIDKRGRQGARGRARPAVRRRHGPHGRALQAGRRDDHRRVQREAKGPGGFGLPNEREAQAAAEGLPSSRCLGDRRGPAPLSHSRHGVAALVPPESYRQAILAIPGCLGHIDTRHIKTILRLNPKHAMAALHEFREAMEDLHSRSETRAAT